MRYAWMSWMLVLVGSLGCGEVKDEVVPVAGEQAGAARWKSQAPWPAVGAEAGLDEVVWVPTKTGASGVKVAYGDGMWLAVWQDARGGVNSVYGMRILDDGTVLDPIGFPVSAHAASSSAPVVAHNGSRFFVAWIDARNQVNDIYGARVEATGTVLDPYGIPMVLSGYPKGNLATASDGQDFMLAYSHSVTGNPGFFVTRVSANGVVVNPQGNLVIGSGINFSNITWVGSHYLLVFSPLSSRLSMARVAVDGTVLDPGGNYIFSGNSNYYVSISSSASDGANALVAYHYYYYYTGSVMRAVRVDSGGVLLDIPNLELSPEYSPQGLRYSHNATAFFQDRYLVVWNDYHVPGDPSMRTETADLYGNIVYPDGTVLVPEGFPVLQEPGQQQNLVMSSGGPGALLAFVDQQRSVNDVRAMLLDENAQPLGEPFYLNVAGNAQYRPKVAVGEAGDGSALKLVVWQDERGVDLDVYAARLGEDGQSLDATAVAVAVEGGTQTPGGVAWSGGAWWVTWEDLRGADADVYVARVTPGGTLADAAGGFVVAGGAGDQGAPAVAGDGAGGAWVAVTDAAGGASAVALVPVAADGGVGTPVAVSDAGRPGFAPAVVRGAGGVFVAWHGFDGLTQQVEGAFVADDGAILWGPRVLSPSASVQLRPAVAFDGARFVVAWEDNRDRVYNVYAAVVEADGTVGAASVLGAADRNQFGPSATFDGERFQVVWEEATDTGSDVRAQRVDAGGAPVDPQAAAITQGASPERAPQVVADGPRRVTVVYSRPVVEHPYGASRIRARQVAYNRAPVASVQSIVTLEDTPAPAVLAAVDADGDDLTYEVVAAPAAGVLSGTPPELKYTPAPGFVGEDAFTYRVSDGYDAVEQPVRVLVLAQAQRPVAHGDAVTTPEDTPVDVLLTGDVAAGAEVSFVIVDEPLHGLFKGTAPALQYNPDADWHGDDFFTFRVSDGVRESDLAVVRLTVTPVNDAPVALDQYVTTTLGRAVSVLLAGTDVDGDELTFAIRAKPAHGTLTGVPPMVRYQPEKHFVGEVTFSFTVSDGELTSEPGVVRVTVDGEVRRELDGDGGLFGCTAAPGVGGRGVRGHVRAGEGGKGKMREQAPAVHTGRYLALLLGLLGLVWLRRRSRR